MRPPVEAPSSKNRITPSPRFSCTWRTPMNLTSSDDGSSPSWFFAPVQARLSGVTVKRCTVPVAIACARAKRSSEAICLAAERMRMPSMPPFMAPTVSSVSAAISVSTTSISTSVKAAAAGGREGRRKRRERMRRRPERTPRAYCS